MFNKPAFALIFSLVSTFFLTAASHAEEYCYKKGDDKKSNIARCLTQAEKGSAKAQKKLGDLYFSSPTKGHYAEAIKWFKKAAKQDYAPAQYKLGSLYKVGRGVEKNSAKSAKWYKKAIKSYRKAAEQGDASAQLALGKIYRRGRGGVKRNRDESAKWYKKAFENYKNTAAQGDTATQMRLAALYSKGLGVKKNPKEAEKWYLKAAEKGEVSALVSLGNLYRNRYRRGFRSGRGDKQDLAIAIGWYEKAAEQGNLRGLRNLGRMYEKGIRYFDKRAGKVIAIGKNYSEAAKWYKKVAELGDVRSQINLAHLYSNDKWDKQSYIEANKWYTKAAEQGSTHAQEMLPLIAWKVEAEQKKHQAAEKKRIAAEKKHQAAEKKRLASLAKKKRLASLAKKKRLAKKAKEKATVISATKKCKLSNGSKEQFTGCLILAKRNDIKAQKIVADMYFDGKGVNQNINKASYWYKRLAKKGNVYAKSQLAAIKEIITQQKAQAKAAKEEKRRIRLANTWYSLLDVDFYKRRGVIMRASSLRCKKTKSPASSKESIAFMVPDTKFINEVERGNKVVEVTLTYTLQRQPYAERFFRGRERCRQYVREKKGMINAIQENKRKALDKYR